MRIRLVLLAVLLIYNSAGCKDQEETTKPTGESAPIAPLKIPKPETEMPKTDW